jgi:hypothetical protein
LAVCIDCSSARVGNTAVAVAIPGQSAITCRYSLAVRHVPVLAVCAMVLSLAMLDACSGEPTIQRSVDTVPRPDANPARFGPRHCSEPSPVHVRRPGFVDMQLVVRGGTGRAVVMEGRPFPSRAEIKIVWRLTGSGSFQLVATGGKGSIDPLGPVIEHPMAGLEGSGTEYGSVFKFPAPGCYVLHAQHGVTGAYAKIVVR